MFWLPVSGWILGLIGMILGGVRRRFSVWSALGLSEHSATMLLVAGSAQILHLMP